MQEFQTQCLSKTVLPLYLLEECVLPLHFLKFE